jgi:sirohydrochlorin ferrochelatase
MQVLNFSSDRHRETQVDLFVQEPFDFDEEYANALVQRLADDIPVRIVRLEALLRLKREAGRPQDLTDVAELLAMRTGGTDG